MNRRRGAGPFPEIPLDSLVHSTICGPAKCPACGALGKPAKRITLGALLKPEARPRIPLQEEF